MAYKDPERQRAYAREWLKRFPEKARAAALRWNRAHREHHNAINRAFRARHRERVNAAIAAYHRAHPEVHRTASRGYRARKLAAEGTFTTADWLELLEVWSWRCAYCGSGGPLQADHRIPLSRGGTNWIANVLPACGWCNTRKHRATEDEFRARLARESPLH